MNQIQQNFVKNNKTLLIFNCLNAVIALAGCILAIVSSKHISDLQIQTGIQTAIIILSSLIIVVALINSLIWFYTRNQRWQRIAIIILLMISIGGIGGIIVGNLIITNMQQFCGYYIQHNYPYDGYDIKTNLDDAISSCSKLEITGYSTEEVVKQLSIIYIIKSCKTYDFGTGANCLSLDSLVVENWSSLYTNQIVSLALLGVYYLANIVFTALIHKKLKEITNQNGFLQNNY
ncbi:transmembrane protein, putative (macronuclear) [Tetrahymena thermophila SB210]|uniref:Transmembrane protein, putative n=1 Tax=Tetrahymena thermophila (strain SB210) TaxID=312017 RepID=I7MKC4_TETTS|nr:transmembrane protein, putative [Tetrahymena thermophila SB210]EAR98160.2 transmembrane protein, putative [Tetrahymena thermophila SB210]|eukprot:XP_001018405.2 transmembrane protein, putative [Tetrahymena thermophila SB210]